MTDSRIPGGVTPEARLNLDRSFMRIILPLLAVGDIRTTLGLAQPNLSTKGGFPLVEEIDRCQPTALTIAIAARTIGPFEKTPAEHIAVGHRMLRTHLAVAPTEIYLATGSRLNERAEDLLILGGNLLRRRYARANDRGLQSTVWAFDVMDGEMVTIIDIALQPFVPNYTSLLDQTG